MGNILKILSQQPQMDSAPKIECPICYLPCRQFKKLHKNPNGQTPHFACIPCRNELLKYWNQPNCPIYTISNCHYFQCESYQKIKQLSACHSHFKNLHKNQFVCSVSPSLQNALYVNKQLIRTIRGKILDSKLRSETIQNVYSYITWFFINGPHDYLSF